ncbi:hypothetical protein H3V17_00690 [Bartonella sp. M0283]|uniref:hypothetical protein n=1 Tax=Bartonella sp. M0283 TaxID=2751016 RepID=UPI0018DDFDE6|nr:hypothetical protein [Bartonella sp. M0283]MBI0162170.1 hypothetical protein [Bartonella sp. M0283]
MTFLSIAEYRPDIADINSDYSDDILNVLPADGSYIPMPGFKAFSKPFPEKPYGAYAARALDGTTSVFAGTATKLFVLDNTDLSWRDITQTGKIYSASDEARWSFASFGNFIIAVNKNDPPQVFELNRSAKFRNLGGNPPRAGAVKVWGDFVCLMQLPDNPNRVYWSGLNDAEFWTVGEKSCDYQDFPDGGSVQGSSEATNPIIFLQSAIYRGTFIPGSDIIFSFQKIHDKRGAKSSNSISSRGEFSFYADEGGFFQITSDGAVTPIGFEKIDRSVFTRMNANNLAEMFCAIDPFYNRVYWAMDYNGSGVMNELMVYDWGLQKWTVISIAASSIMPIYTSGYTLDGLDNISTILENLPFSLDSKIWQGGAPILGAFSVDYRLGSFSGEAMEAIVSSQEIAAPNGDINRLENVIAQIDTNEALLAIGARMRRNPQEPVKWSGEKSPSYNTGRYHGRSRARFHKFRLRVPAGAKWSHISGFNVDFTRAGKR